MHNLRIELQAATCRGLGTRPGRNRPSGFTLIELLVTVLVLMALLVLAMPSFRDMTRSQTAGALGTQLHQDLAAARVEAVKLQLPVAVESVSGTNWNNGWFVYVDTDSNGALNGAETKFREQSALSTGYVVSVQDTGGAALTRIVFNGRGAANTAANGQSCAPGWSASNNRQYSRTVRLLANGIADVSKGSLSGASCP